jgi:two-component system response regulator CpxR
MRSALPRNVKKITSFVARGKILADDNCSASKYNSSMKQATTTASILLIDDDKELGSMLCDYLASDHLQLVVENTGETGLRALAAGSFDLLILDIMLPGINGLEVLKQVRRKNQIPVIMLTARGDDIDRIIGLEIGADDYLSKPFNPRELLARIRAILRRAHGAPNSKVKLQLGSIELDTRTHQASVVGNAMTLTGTEFEILRSLLETPGEVVSKEQLSERALGRRLLPYDRSIDTHISNLRGKLERAGNRDVTIQNQRGIGYLLIPGGES